MLSASAPMLVCPRFVRPALRSYHRGRRGSLRSSRWRASLTLKSRPPSVVPLSPSIAARAEAVSLQA